MSNHLTITPVLNRKDLLAFIEFPFQLYHRDSNWVPPLIEERLDFFNVKKNPFFEHARSQLFLARRDGVTVGTIGAVVDDNHNRVHNEKMGAFGFFESIDDQPVADALLETAESWVRGQGMNLIRGPYNFSANQEMGLLIDGYDTPPVVMMTHNPAYYSRLVENGGYCKAMDVYAYTSQLQQGWDNAPEKLFRVADKASQKNGIRVRKANIRRFAQEVELIKQVYNAAWMRNWGFVPMTDHEIDYLAKSLRPLVDPNLVLIAETEDGKPIGVSLTLPDMNQALRWSGGGHMWPFGLLKFLWQRRKINQCRLMIMGVLEEYRSQGVDAIFYVETARAALARGYQMLESSWILETNTMMNRILEHLGARRYKTYRIYEKPLQAD